MNIRFSKTEDLLKIQELLFLCNLPAEDIFEQHVIFILYVNENKNEFIGVVGLEFFGSVALLRSLAVKESVRNNGIAKILLQNVIKEANIKDVSSLYVLTTTASSFFSKHGFSIIDRSLVPNAILKTKQFNEICPLSATCMTKDISKEV